MGAINWGARLIRRASNRAWALGREVLPRPHALSAASGGKVMAKTVMIVEDNELNMKRFHDLLDAHGYDTIQTRDGKDAYELAQTHHPDLIVMDMQLPGVSGLEVTRLLKEDDTLKGIPVIAVTAFAMKGDEDRIREGGGEAYIAKPIRIDELMGTVRHFLGE